MATEVVIPKLGMTMKEGTIVEWVVADGALVERDEVLFVLSTDKLDTDVSAEASGVLRHQAQAGETHPVSTVVGLILSDGDVIRGVSDDHVKRIVASPYARRLARERGVDLDGVVGTGPGRRILAGDVPAPVAAALPAAAVPTPPAAIPAATPVATPAATPVARRMAERLGVDLASLAGTGTGPAGRITKEDVESRSQDSIPLRGMRKVIAERMHASLQEMAQLTLGMEVDMTDAASLRRQLIEEWEADGVRVSFTDLVGRAAVKALRAHPALNASVQTDVIRLHPDVNLGLAVAVHDGLLVPVIGHADQLSLMDLSAEAARLAAACRAGGISVDALEGATFTLTALGSSGVDFFTPVINPPNVAILGIGRVHDGVAWVDDRPVRRQMMTLSLTIDHRAVDGVPGAAFLTHIKELLESPYRLLV